MVAPNEDGSVLYLTQSNPGDGAAGADFLNFNLDTRIWALDPTTQQERVVHDQSPRTIDYSIFGANQGDRDLHRRLGALLYRDGWIYFMASDSSAGNAHHYTLCRVRPDGSGYEAWTQVTALDYPDIVDYWAAPTVDFNQSVRFRGGGAFGVTEDGWGLRICEFDTKFNTTVFRVFAPDGTARGTGLGGFITTGRGILTPSGSDKLRATMRLSSGDWAVVDIQVSALPASSAVQVVRTFSSVTTPVTVPGRTEAVAAYHATDNSVAVIDAATGEKLGEADAGTPGSIFGFGPVISYQNNDKARPLYFCTDTSEQNQGIIWILGGCSIGDKVMCLPLQGGNDWAVIC